MACRYKRKLKVALRKNKRGFFVSLFVFHASKESQKHTGYCTRIIHNLGGFSMLVDVPMVAHGLIFVDDVLDSSP